MAVQEKIEPEELIEALETIIKVCRENVGCSTCPLRDKEHENSCFILQTDKVPSKWKIKGVTEWRALDE